MTTYTGLECTACGWRFGILVPTSDPKRDLKSREFLGKRPCPHHDPPRSAEEVDIIQWQS